MRVDSNPIGRMVEEFLATAYVAHPYGRPNVGWESELSQITATEAAAFHQSYYVPSNIVIAVAGLGLAGCSSFSMDAFRPFETSRCTGELSAADARARQRVPAKLASDAKNRSREYIGQHCNAGSCFESPRKSCLRQPTRVTLTYYAKP